MKTLKLFGCEDELPFDASTHLVWSIENKAFRYRVLRKFINDDIGDLISVFDDNDEVPLDKNVHFIPNLFDLNLNSRQNANALLKILRKAYSIEMSDNVDNLKKLMEEAMEKIALDFDLELEYQIDLTLDDLFKIGNIRLKENDEGFSDAFLGYVSAIQELRGISVFVFFGLHELLGETEMQDLLHSLDYKRISTIDIENCVPDVLAKSENVVVLDKDMCSL